MGEEIKSAVKTLFSVSKEREIVDKFAREAYKEKFKDRERQPGTYHGYSDFGIVNDHTIRVIYEYGTCYGDIDYRDFFDVELI